VSNEDDSCRIFGGEYSSRKLAYAKKRIDLFLSREVDQRTEGKKRSFQHGRREHTLRDMFYDVSSEAERMLLLMPSSRASKKNARNKYAYGNGRKKLVLAAVPFVPHPRVFRVTARLMTIITIRK